MYSNAIPFMTSWTRMMWPLSQGFCVSETMRFDGTGWYTDGGTGNNSCDSTAGLSYNKLTLSSGAELASWIWRQYQNTDDRAFLERSLPHINRLLASSLEEAVAGAELIVVGHGSAAYAHDAEWRAQGKHVLRLA